MDCQFCKALKKQQELQESLITQPGRSGETKIIYRVALVRKTFYDGVPCGTSTSESFPLNVCPVCGAKITKTEVTDAERKI